MVLLLEVVLPVNSTARQVHALTVASNFSISHYVTEYAINIFLVFNSSNKSNDAVCIIIIIVLIDHLSLAMARH